MAYQPKLFIGIGETAAYFTLRETHLVYIPGEGPYGNAIVNGVYQGTTRVESHHVCNLSQNIDEAIEKAKGYADVRAMPLVPPDAYTLGEEMRKIERAGAEEMERRRLAEEARQAEYLAMRAQWEREREIQQDDLLRAGRFPFGRHIGEAFEEVDIGYVNWIMDKRDEFEPGSHMRRLADALWEQAPELKLPAPHPTAVLGEVGKRIEVEVRAIRQTSFETQFGRKYVTTMVGPGGECVVVLSTAWAMEPGECAKIKGTVREHGEYKGQAQTILQRVKTMMEVENGK